MVPARGIRVIQNAGFREAVTTRNPGQARPCIDTRIPSIMAVASDSLKLTPILLTNSEIAQRGWLNAKSLRNWVARRATPRKNESGSLRKRWVKNTFSAESERGEGITGRERGVRY